MNSGSVYLISLVGVSLSLALSVLGYLLVRSRRQFERSQSANVDLKGRIKELTSLIATAKQEYESKLKFFIDISHELRTPLTLILTPLDDLIATSPPACAHTKSLLLIQKNAFRLLRLVNQLIDLRKIELGKLSLKSSENDLVQATRQMMEAFDELAAKRKIDFRLITQERELNVWFDPGMLEKVLFNLLFNAFKFTTNTGLIYVKIDKTDREVIITVEDSGVGMSAEVVKRAFDLFHETDFNHGQSFGLGLALAKELIDLHQGEIVLASTQWKGTTVSVHLPLGSSHLKKEQTGNLPLTPEKLTKDSSIYVTEFQDGTYAITERDELAVSKDNSILIIEDNDDLRKYLSEKLADTYEVLLADNGIMGLQMAYGNIPDLILCDVNMPGRSGIDVIRILKGDFKTSHIPVVLITSNSSVEHQIEGIKSMADAYIIKPFNLQFLRETVRSLLKGRVSLREHFTTEITADDKGYIVNKLDKKFVNDFSAIVEGNLSNEDFTVDTICRSIGVSKVQLYRKVKVLLEINVNDYIINRRLQKAKYLLKHEQLPISEIAAKVGFSSAAYFSTVFKSKFNVTPKQYKSEKRVA